MVKQSDLECLIPREKIARRVAELAREIQADCPPDGNLLMVVMLTGAMVFASDLMRALTLPLEVDTIAGASYERTGSTGTLTLRSRLKRDPAGRDILLVDDILDSGLTLRRVGDFLRRSGAASVRTCVLLDKQVPRHPEGAARADYAAFQIPDRFVVGFGLDADERWRNLPDVMALPPCRDGGNR